MEDPSTSPCVWLNKQTESLKEAGVLFSTDQLVTVKITRLSPLCQKDDLLQKLSSHGGVTTLRHTNPRSPNGDWLVDMLMHQENPLPNVFDANAYFTGR
eukprot:m.233765 g.233765  ORF g.233765 m.233765 type:complete len:99 (+) comp26511_c0_seq1:95-391(+)